MTRELEDFRSRAAALERRLTELRRASDAERARHLVSENRLVRRLAAERERRVLEEARALTEGGHFRFFSWGRTGHVAVTTLVLWLLPRSDVLMYGRADAKTGSGSKGGGAPPLSGSSGRVRLSARAEALASTEIRGVALGADLFPRRQPRGLLGGLLSIGGDAEQPDPDASFTLLLEG